MYYKKYRLPGVAFLISGFVLVSCDKVDFGKANPQNEPTVGFETVDSGKSTLSEDSEGTGLNVFRGKSNAFDPSARYQLKPGNSGTGDEAYKSGISDSEDLGESGMTKNKPKASSIDN